MYTSQLPQKKQTIFKSLSQQNSECILFSVSDIYFVASLPLNIAAYIYQFWSGGGREGKEGNQFKF